MKENDVELIHRILDGDDTAFSDLVEKYQRQVHALAWRKIGDFHFAEEITQDTFLKAYKKLATLKKPHRFAGWLYVIATHCCQDWLRKKQIQTESLEDIDSEKLEPEAYSRYVAEQEVKAIAETQRQVVKKLLATLPESERTVITLHYFGEMTCEKMSEFLGVSANTIKSRLRRARNRLKKEEPMIREAISNFQISPNLTDNIMKEIARLKPGAPTSGKPLMPWAIAASSAVLIVLMLGIGSQYLARFQQPYSLDTQAEMTVELIDASVVLNLEVKSDIQNRLGSSNARGESDSIGQKPDAVLLAAAQTEGENNSVPKQQWIQENGPVGSGYPMTLFPTPEGEIYIVHNEGRNYKLYKLPIDGTELQHVSDISSLLIDIGYVSMATKWNDTLYVVLSNEFDELNELFASTDGGETWLSVGKCPAGMVVGLEVMDDTFYLALEHQIFVSEDTGKTWPTVYEGLIGEVHNLKEIHNTLYATTSIGIYRLDAGSWQRLQFPIPEAKKIVSFAGTENILYALTEWDWENVGPQERTWWIFRSTDKGQSWKDITPTNALPIMGPDPFEKEPWATLVAMKNTLLVIGWSGTAVVRSIDNGNTWTLEEITNIPLMHSSSVHNAVALNENTFYLQGNSGIYRSIDGGISWTRFYTEMKSSIIKLICDKTNKEQNTPDSLYAMFSAGMEQLVFKSSDKGKTWRVVNPEKQIKERIPSITRIVESGGVLYAKCQGPTSSAIMSIYRISEDRNTLVPIKGMPFFDSSSLFNLLLKERGAIVDPSDMSFVEQLQKSSAGATQFFKQLAHMAFPHADNFRQLGLRGAFTVSGDTFYLEYNFKLFRWEPGDTEWYDTEQEETILTFLTIVRLM